MKKVSKLSSTAMSVVKLAAMSSLKGSANSTTSFLLYQPKAPAKLKDLRRF